VTSAQLMAASRSLARDRIAHRPSLELIAELLTITRGGCAAVTYWSPPCSLAPASAGWPS